MAVSWKKILTTSDFYVDVIVESPAVGEVLAYSETGTNHWENATLDSLGMVTETEFPHGTINSGDAGEILYWDGDSWEQGAPSSANIIAIASPTDGDLAYYDTDTWVGQSLPELDIVTAAAALTDGKVVIGAGGEAVAAETLAWDETDKKLSGLEMLILTDISLPSAVPGALYVLAGAITTLWFAEEISE